LRHSVQMKGKMRILSNSANFLLVTLLPAYNLTAPMSSTYSNYRLGAMALKFLAIENMPRITGAVAYCRLEKIAAGGCRGNPTG